MKQAVCVLIEHPVTGRVVAVSRRDDLTNWGLPGGKVEPGEELKDAARRELYEETGLLLSQKDQLKLVFSDTCYGETDYMCSTFRLVKPSDRVLGFQYVDSTEGKVEWKAWGDLTQSTCSFKAYNWKLIMKLNAIDYVKNT